MCIVPLLVTCVRIELNGTNTALIADLDQSGSYGVLNRLQALGLELVELTRLTDD